MQIMLIWLAPENELRYVIGVIQQYVGVILDRPTEQHVTSSAVSNESKNTSLHVESNF